MTNFKPTNCSKYVKPIKNRISAIDSSLLDEDKIALRIAFRTSCRQIWTTTQREPRLERLLLKS